MTLNLYLVFIALLLVLVDLLFFRSCHLTVAALVLLFIDLQYSIDVHILVRLFMTVIAIFLIWQFYDRLWDIIMEKWPIKSRYRERRYHSNMEGLVGQSGVVKLMDGKKFAYVKGNLYLFYRENDLKDGDSFRIKNVVDGLIVPED